MIKKRHIPAIVLAFCLVTSFIIASVGYDPWIDLDDDGDIDPDDFALFAGQYGTSGTPINKTELLLELEARIDSLNLTLLTEYYDITECHVVFVDASGDVITGYLKVDSGTLYVDDVNNRVGIGNTSPTYTLDVDGTMRASQIRLGSADGNHVIYFYEGGYTEYFYWQDSGHRFILSDDIYISGSLDVTGSINIPTTTRYYSLPGCAWQPYSWSYDTRSGIDTWTTTAGVSTWFAPVNLPHGAVVTEFRAWVQDEDPSVDISVYLYRQIGGLADQMALVVSSGSSSAYLQYADSSINYATVDNQNYAYLVHAVLRSGSSLHRLANVRITYTVTETLP